MYYSVDDYDYHLPEDRIAQTPVTPRDRSRLLVLQRHCGLRAHRLFEELDSLLRPGDVLVLNNTRVVPVRLTAIKPTGGKVEFLVLDVNTRTPSDETTSHDETEMVIVQRCLMRGAPRQLPGPLIGISPDLQARVLSRDNGVYIVQFHCAKPFYAILEAIGRMPLPPYIQRRQDQFQRLDQERYQTIYAAQRGAVAAPTAGLHFTHGLLERLHAGGIRLVYITLHVGYGTFMPVRVRDIREHAMHSEDYIISPFAADTINQARAAGQRIVAVGTTCVRTLEDAARGGNGLQPGRASCHLFIYPGFEFKCVDALITNFHLPRSTLLMLTAAFAGRENVLEAYREAVQEKYRFFSYGDAMLIE